MEEGSWQYTREEGTVESDWLTKDRGKESLLSSFTVQLFQAGWR
jgi:hypothetical protein